MMRMAPAYTLETLAECDIDMLLPFFYANTAPSTAPQTPGAPAKSNIVYRGGKPYKIIKADEASWAKNIF